MWAALSDAQQFGQWFGVRFDGAFVAGAALAGVITPTTVDAEVARQQAKHEGRRFHITVETVSAPTRFSFRWHPYEFDEKQATSREVTTLVEFVLTETPQGTELVVTESGFDRVPLDRRAEAFNANDGGWEAQTQLIKKYLEQNA